MVQRHSNVVVGGTVQDNNATVSRLRFPYGVDDRVIRRRSLIDAVRCPDCRDATFLLAPKYPNPFQQLFLEQQ